MADLMATSDWPGTGFWSDSESEVMFFNHRKRTRNCTRRKTERNSASNRKMDRKRNGIDISVRSLMATLWNLSLISSAEVVSIGKCWTVEDLKKCFVISMTCRQRADESMSVSPNWWRSLSTDFLQCQHVFVSISNVLLNIKKKIHC